MIIIPPPPSPSTEKERRREKNYLFCVGFGTLRGAFRKLASTASLGSFILAGEFLRLVEAEEAIDSRNLLGKLHSLGLVLSMGREEGEQMRRFMRINADRAAKALELAVIVLGLKEVKRDGLKMKGAVALIYIRTLVFESSFLLISTHARLDVILHIFNCITYVCLNNLWPSLGIFYPRGKLHLSHNLKRVERKK